MTIDAELLPAVRALRKFMKDAPEVIRRDDLERHPILAALALLADDFAGRVDRRALEAVKCSPPDFRRFDREAGLEPLLLGAVAGALGVPV